MSMEIKNMSVDGVNKPARSSAQGPRDAKTGDAGVSRTNAERPASPNDSVTLTRGARQLAQLDGAQNAPVDSKRVQSIRQNLKNGSYVIDPSRVADKLIGMELPGKRQG